MTEQAPIESDLQAIRSNLAMVHETIQSAASNASRDQSAVTLIAVSKAQPDAKILAALAAGQRVFGENYVQEAQARWPDLRNRYNDLEVHMIGPLQTNKAAQAVRLFDVIQTVDRPKLARELQKEMTKQNRALPIFIQVNTGEEPQKSGIIPAEAEAFLRFCQNELSLQVRGLMAIPPVDQDTAMHAALLKRMADDFGLPDVSIGMSGDYPTAIEFGATMVRVGTGIFGARKPKNNAA